MKVECIKKGNVKNLTVGKIYDVIEKIDNDHYLVKADNGLINKYKNTLLKEVDETIKFNLDDLVVSNTAIQYKINDNYIFLTDEFDITNILNELNIIDTEMSDEIKQIDGFNIFIAQLVNLLDLVTQQLTNLNVIKINSMNLAAKIFDNLFKDWLEEKEETCKFLLLGCKEDCFGEIRKYYHINVPNIINDIGMVNINGDEPNDGNEIYLWVFEMN